MTDEPTPKEIGDLFVEETGFDIDDFPAAIFGFARAVLAKWGQPAHAEEPVARLVIGKTKGGVSLTHMVVPAAYQLQEGMYALYTAPQPVARVPLPKFLALKFHARRDKKATVTLLFPGHEAADAWVRSIRGGQHGTE